MTFTLACMRIKLSTLRTTGGSCYTAIELTFVCWRISQDYAFKHKTINSTVTVQATALWSFLYFRTQMT